jgi:hypothetical protein
MWVVETRMVGIGLVWFGGGWDDLRRFMIFLPYGLVVIIALN